MNYHSNHMRIVILEEHVARLELALAGIIENKPSTATNKPEIPINTEVPCYKTPQDIADSANTGC
jgi:hypothetical protein